MRLGRDQFSQWLPHAGKMILVDSVSEWNDRRIICHTGTHLDADNPLRAGEGLPAHCGVEYAAQAMAIHAGLLSASAGGADRPRAGYLGSVRGLKLYASTLDDVPCPLELRADKIMGDGSGMIYSFEVNAGDRMLLCGRAAVVLVEGPQ